jgi:hydrogenase maturation protease
VKRVVVIGVGNAYRGDDGAGLAVVERLHGRVPDGVEVVEMEQEPTRLIDAWDGADSVVVIDAVASGGEPGELHRYDASADPLPARVFRSSTHAFGVGDAIEIARVLGTLPGHVLVYGIEGADFEAREGLSAPVGAAVDQLADTVLEELCTSAP